MSNSTACPHNTPWGEKQIETEIMPGFVSVDTSGHGGIWLAPEHAAKIPAFLKKFSADGRAVWWEEDTAWSLPIFCLLSGTDLAGEHECYFDTALDAVREYYPGLYKAIGVYKSLRRITK
jgi:hypothetical protein